MDERETVPRRDAIVGLSLLGIFSLTLTGTLAYRIVYPTQHIPPKVVINEWKSQGPLPNNPSDLFAPDANAPQLATEEFPTVDPIPTVMEGSPSVPASAINDVEPPPHVEASAAIKAPQPAEAPTFVAPSYR
jgi:hypothetical protein